MAGVAEAGRIVAVVEIGALNAFDRTQRIGADRGIAGHGAERHIDADPAGRVGHVVVLRGIEAAAAIDEVVAGEAREVFVVGAAQQAVAEHRAHHGVDAAVDDVDADRREIELV